MAAEYLPSANQVRTRICMLAGGRSLSVQDNFGTYTFGTCFFGTSSFGTLNVNIGTITFGTYKGKGYFAECGKLSTGNLRKIRCGFFLRNEG